MGLGRLAWIADNLILNGRSFMEPAAVVSRASLPDTRVVVGTLGTIAGTAADLPSPSLVIVGEVAKLAWQVRELAQEVGRRG
jgi:Uroporphyrinogen-III methylase